ncbi:MAG: hypothetical protein ABUL54_11025 [Dongia sp.]
MFQNIQFRDCTHRTVVGPTTDAVMAAVLGDHCAPGTPPMEAASLFYGTAQVLGEAEFRKLWSEFQNPATGRMANPLDFAGFLGAHEHGRMLPALPDVARFDLAYTLAAQPGPAPSIAACCLPEATIRGHRDMMLRFQPNWRYVALGWPVHRLLADTLTADLLRTFSGAEPAYLRIAPTGMGVNIAELAPADFALQATLRDGKKLGEAVAAAHAIDPALDPFPIVAGLVEAGAILDVVLHPADAPSLRQPVP